ncbi:putative reverse transcriptase domain-containing protein [Tanacetum coccineum]
MRAPAPPPSPICSLGYRAAMIQMRAEAAYTSHSLPLPPPFILSPTRPDAPSLGIPSPLPISVPTSSPPLLLPSTSRESSSAATARPAGGLRADYGFVTTTDREIRRDPERDVGYGITDSWDEIVETPQGAPVSTDTELGRHMTAFETRVRQDTDEIYTRLDDEQMMGQMSEIKELHAADRRRQAVTSEMLKADHRRSAEMREDRLPHCRDSRDPLEVLHSQSCQRRLAMIDQGVNAALAARDANRNGDDNHTSGTVGRRTERALTWWNSHVLTVSHDVTYAMTWADLRKKMTNKYFPRNEMKKLETELLNLKVKGTDVIGYNQRLQELALLCVRMFPKESNKIERYVGGLPDMIHGNIVASKPNTMQEAVEMATELMDKKVSTIAERHAENKRKFENTSRNNQNQQQQNKRQNTGRAYTARSSDKKQYGGSKTLCVKCNYHHDSPCAPKCHKCNKFGHFARDCRSAGNANNTNNQRGTGLG